MTDKKQAMNHPLAYTATELAQMTIPALAATARQIRELLEHAKTHRNFKLRDVRDLTITLWRIDNMLVADWLKDEPERTSANQPQAPGAPGNEH